MSGILAATTGSQPGYNPALDATVIQWLKADAISQSDSTAVSTWPNSAGVDVTQATGSAQPIFKTAILNGLPVVRFNGTSQYLKFSGSLPSAIAQPLQLFVVFKSSNFNSINNTFIVSSSNVHFLTTGTGHWEMWANSAGVPGVTLNTSNGLWNIGCFEFNGASSRYALNTTSLTNTSSSPGSLSMSASFTLGAYASFGGSFAPGYSQMDMAEVIVRTGIATSSPVMNYLNGRYAVY